MIVVPTRVAVAVLARRVRSSAVESVVRVQGGQVMVVAQQRQVVSWSRSICAQSQIPRSRTRRPIVVAAVAAVAAARVREVVVQRGQLVVMVVVVVAQAQLVVAVRGRRAAEDVVDHKPGTGRLEDGHGAALNWHRHLGG